MDYTGDCTKIDKRTADYEKRDGIIDRKKKYHSGNPDGRSFYCLHRAEYADSGIKQYYGGISDFGIVRPASDNRVYYASWHYIGIICLSDPEICDQKSVFMLHGFISGWWNTCIFCPEFPGTAFWKGNPGMWCRGAGSFATDGSILSVPEREAWTGNGDRHVSNRFCPGIRTGCIRCVCRFVGLAQHFHSYDRSGDGGVRTWSRESL